jgi:hypothetical protein
MQNSSINVFNRSKSCNKETSPAVTTLISTNISSIGLNQFQEEFNFPFVIHNELRQRKFSASTHSRNKSSSSIERKSTYNEKNIKINHLVNNNGHHQHQICKTPSSGLYFYKEHTHQSFNKKANEELIQNGNFIKQNILNDTKNDTHEIVHRFNALNIPDIENKSKHQQQLQLHTVSLQKLDETSDFYNHSSMSNTTASTTKGSNKLSKLLKHLKKKMTQSNKVEKFQQVFAYNLNPADLSINGAQAITYSKQSKPDNSLPQQKESEPSKKQNFDIITKIFKAYNRKFDKTIKTHSKNKHPCDDPVEPQHVQSNEISSSCIKSSQSEPNLTDTQAGTPKWLKMQTRLRPTDNKFHINNVVLTPPENYQQKVNEKAKLKFQKLTRLTDMDNVVKQVKQPIPKQAIQKNINNNEQELNEDLQFSQNVFNKLQIFSF